MINIGIVNPNWTLQRHNTDARCVIDFSNMDTYAKDLAFQFIGTQSDYIKANINFLSQRLLQTNFFDPITLNGATAKVDVLYRYGGDVLGLKVEEKSSIPLISTMGFPTLNQDKLKGKAYLLQEAEKLVGFAKECSLIHFHTDCMREHFLSIKPEWEDKCFTAPFFLPHLKFLPEHSLINKFSLNEKIKILFVGADGERKGLNELCEAIDFMADFLFDHQVSLTIVSKTAPSCKRFKNVVHHRHLERESVQMLMRQSHLYVMVPKLEPFGLVYVEAMAAGCAVIADNDVPRHEILEGGNCGRLVEVNNVSLLASEIKNLIENRTELLEMALRGWRRAQVRYAPEVVSKQYAQVFKDLVSQGLHERSLSIN
jgi:glycosyltransferase involved in cell wall biosynthesis